MIPKVLEQWHALLKSRDVNSLDSLLAENATMYSPVVHTPQVGKAITKMYLMGAMMVIGNEHFRYIREVYNDSFAVLEFETKIDGKVVNGVDMITWNSDNKITEFKVMIRPLQGINAVHQAMGAALANFKG
jgi:ketosteroid isomerase-like protein